MSEQDKQLLLVDLCARLPYGVICTDNRHGDSRIFNIDVEDESVYYTDFDEYGSIENCKPYLRPMSSMTEEEDKEWQYYKGKIAESCDDLLEQRIEECHGFFNSHHFDFRNLIGKGLALEAPDGMY